MADEYSERQELLRIPGYEKLQVPRKCKECRTMNKIMSKRHKLQICFHCGSKEEKRIGTTNPLAAILATALLVLCGCQAPREMRVDANVCGQQLKVSVMR
jgi:hypothetical protein